jgi:hypothetical protein
MHWGSLVRLRRAGARIVAAGIASTGIAVVVAVTLSLPAATGACTTHQCDTSSGTFVGGRMVDAITYETSDWDDTWISYPGEITLRVQFPPSVTRVPQAVQCYVGDGPSPNGGPGFQGGQAWTECSGQLGELALVDATGFTVTNASCEAYYARFVATFPSPSLTLFGGLGAGGATLDDTWTWDGASWLYAGEGQTSGLSGRQQPLLATVVQTDADAGGRSGTFLYGGFDGASAQFDTWAWGGASWTQVFLPPDDTSWPSTRSDAASAVLGNAIVLFGGLGPGAGGSATDLGDQWTFDGTRWIELSPPTPPPSPRSGATAATLSGSMVLFGGTASGALQGDTWTWNGAAWSQPSVSAPPARAHASMATLGSTVVLFGGDGGSGPLGDTWLWDGTTWTSPSLASAPSPRSGAAMTAFQGTVVLFGGADASGPLGDTWIWDGAAWSAWSPSSSVGLSPPPRSGAAMASP